MNNTVDVAVIIINYNTSSYTLSCVESIIKNTRGPLKYRIIIIDNASEIDDFRLLEKAIHALPDDSNIELYRSKINLGFSGGNMLGVSYVDAKYYFFLNNDCIIQNDCITILYDFCEQKTDVALCSPQLYKEDGTHQPCINYFPSLKTKIFGNAILRLTYGKDFFKRKAIYTEPVKVDVISGSQMFIRAAPFRRIGGFDTTLFLYGEEDDIAFRLRADGNSAYLVPAAKNVHIGGASTQKTYDIRKEFYISFLYVYRKHYGSLKTLVLSLILALRLLRKIPGNSDNIRLIMFILSGARPGASLRHKQQIKEQ